jgi:3-oxoacyl-[acyl-carrier protein] reductase
VAIVGLLDGKVALITGSGRNIGRATALRFAAEGAAVVVNARADRAAVEAVAGEIRALGSRALPVVADVGDQGQVKAMVERAVAEFGKVDVLISAAAIRPHKPFLEITAADWHRVRGTVLDGAIFCSQAVLPSMLAAGGGSAVFIAGDGAWAGGAERAHIGAAKMGLIGLSRSLASEFAPGNVRFNVLAPGRVDTIREGGKPTSKDAVASIPLGRLGHVNDIASALLFLVSDESSWITGQTLHVNGGSAYF